MMRTLLIHPILFLMVFSPGVAAQVSSPSFTPEVLTTDDGLPTNLLTGLAQTPDGYLWIGSQDGLVRFDGTRFTVFNSSNTDAFTNNRVAHLWTDPRGSLWVHTGDFSLLRYEGGSFRRLNFGGEKVYTLHSGKMSSLIATQTGLYRDHDARLESVASGNWDERITDIVQTRDGAFWAAGNQGTVVRLTEGEVQQPLKAPRGAQTPLPGRGLLHEAADGTVWIFSGRQLWRYRAGLLTMVPARKGASPGDVVSLGTDSEGRLLLETLKGDTLLFGEDGAYHRLHPSDPRFQAHSRRFPDALKCRHGPRGPCFIKGRQVAQVPFAQAAIQDHEGGFWVASNRDGLHYLRPTLVDAYGREEGLSDPVVYALAEAGDGTLWTVGSSDLYRFTKGAFRIAFPFEKSHTSGLFSDRAGTIWFIRGGLVYRIEEGGLQPFAQDGLPPTWAICQDASGSYWFATGGGLYAWSNGQWTAYPEASRGIVGPYQISGTRDGAIWILSDEAGLRRFHQGRLYELAAHGLPFSDVRHLYEDQDGLLWAASGGRGLYRIDPSHVDAWVEKSPSRLEITSYRVRDGLFDEVIHRIVEDSQGRLWMSTNRGIFWVRRSELNAFAEGQQDRIRSVAYDTRHGMLDREANRLGGLKDRTGKLWFSTMGGVVRIDPDRVGRMAPAPTVIEQLRSGGDSFRVQGGLLQLSPRQRSFEIDFTTTSFFNPESVDLRYRLEGYDEDWVRTDRRTAVYSQVPPGRYRFRVAASDEAVAADEANLVLVVSAGWYETLWFRLLATLSGVSLLFGVVWARRQRRPLPRAAQQVQLHDLNLLVAPESRPADPEIELPPAPRRRSALETHLRELIVANLAEEDFGVERLAWEGGLSRSQLFRRLRKEAGTTPTQLIRKVRVEQAARLFEERAGNVTEVAYAVGFKSLSHFTRCFREHYHVSPSDFLQSSGR